MGFNLKFFLLSLIFLIQLVNFYECKMSVTDRLTELRKEMTLAGIDAYIIVTDDEHQSEYVSAYDKRRSWLSGFTGSAGTAVVTQNKSVLWTDSRYTLQAAEELVAPWQAVDSSNALSPTINDWLISELGAGQKVGQMARFTSISAWQSRETELTKKDIQFVNPPYELVDKIWPSDERPAKPKTPIEIHDITYADQTWQAKIEAVQARIKKENVDFYVVTALDEVAWLFNMRASDIPYNPMFLAYGLVFADGGGHRLYIDQTRLNNNPQLLNHLNGLVFRNYDQITDDVKQLSDSGKRAWISPMSSYAIYSSVSNKNLLFNSKASPVRSLKGTKSKIEIENIRRCQIRDSAARIRHMYWLETEMKKGSVITEMTAADQLEAIQAKDSLFKGLSFNSIAAVGSNAAIVHYSTMDGKNSTLTKDKVFLLDAGAQYLDCTSDITRTHHYGEPTQDIKYAYTRVLMGSIDLLNVVFPTGVYGNELDVLARSALWRQGLDYGHGTGHGIGYFLSVHEAPPTTSYNSRSVYAETFVEGMIQSDEPGYYLEGKFGIRLETDIEVVKADFQTTFNNKQYLKFSALSLVPFETNLIDSCLLTNAQVDWLNQYNKEIREKVGRLFKDDPEMKSYMESKTGPFKYSHTYSTCPSFKSDASQTVKSFSNLFLALVSTLTLLVLNY